MQGGGACSNIVLEMLALRGMGDLNRVGFPEHA